LPKSPGAPPFDDSAAIQLMVQLLGADPSLTIRAAAREATKRLRLPGNPKTHEERLRRKFRRLRVAEKLPAFQRPLDRAKAEIRETYAAREAVRAQRTEQLAAREKEAELLGLAADIDRREDLSAFLKRLELEMEGLELYARDSSLLVPLLMEQCPTTEEAEEKLAANVERFHLLQKQVEVVRDIHNLRTFLSGIRRVLPQRARPTGEEIAEAGEES
jgi:hypothetical protein